MKKGEKFDNIAVAVTSRRTPQGKKGPYTRMTVRTRTGKTYEAIYWEGEIDLEVSEAGKIMLISGVVDEYNGEIQLKVNRGFDVAKDEDATEFLPSVPEDEHQANLKVISSINALIVHPGLQRFVRFCISKWVNQFKESTGALKNHHAMRHGLVKHIREMIVVTETLIEEYIGRYLEDENGELAWRCAHTEKVLSKQEGRQLDADITRTAVPLHDWGKMEEYSTRGAAFIETKAGELRSHPDITTQRLSELRIDFHRLAEEKDKPDWFIDDDLFTELMHVIGSHHGQVRFNACSPPKTLPAMIVHIADYTSCFMDVAREQAYAEGLRGTFTDERFPNPDFWKVLMRS